MNIPTAFKNIPTALKNMPTASSNKLVLSTNATLDLRLQQDVKAKNINKRIRGIYHGVCTVHAIDFLLISAESTKLTHSKMQFQKSDVQMSRKDNKSFLFGFDTP